MIPEFISLFFFFSFLFFSFFPVLHYVKVILQHVKGNCTSCSVKPNKAEVVMTG